jgi:hypothetical protein
VGGVYSLRDDAGNVVRTGRTNNLARRALGRGIFDVFILGAVFAKPGAVAAAESGAGKGSVYLRRSGVGSKPYVGQSIHDARYEARQVEHGRAEPMEDFEFMILGRAAPGVELDRLEEYYIRQHGGPTNRGNPGGGLANRRHQMSGGRYDAAGGDPFP